MTSADDDFAYLDEQTKRVMRRPIPNGLAFSDNQAMVLDPLNRLHGAIGVGQSLEVAE